MRTVLCLLLGLNAGSVAADARVNYLLHCAGCHRVDGTGLPPEIPSLAGPIGPFAGFAQGRDYLIRVPGASQAPINDEELAAVLNWVLESFNTATLPADFRPLQKEEVSASRPHVLDDPIATRGKIWTDYGKP